GGVVGIGPRQDLLDGQIRTLLQAVRAVMLDQKAGEVGAAGQAASTPEERGVDDIPRLPRSAENGAASAIRPSPLGDAVRLGPGEDLLATQRRVAGDLPRVAMLAQQAGQGRAARQPSAAED